MLMSLMLSAHERVGYRKRTSGDRKVDLEIRIFRRVGYFFITGHS